MRDSELEVMERLLRSHPKLKDATLVDPDEDPPDAIATCEAGRYGFELTDIFSVGGSNSRGSEYLQFNRQWQELKKHLVSVLQHRHANLDQCDIYLRLNGQSENSFAVENLPRPTEYEKFAVQLLRAIFAHRPAFNTHSDQATDVAIPNSPEFGLLRLHATRIEIIWRPGSFSDVNVAADVHLPAVDGGYLNTGTEKLEAAILRKGTPSREQRSRIKAADVREMYLVLGGQRTGMLPHLQAQTRAGLERDMSFVRYPFEQSIFDAIILFDDFNDKTEVFCTRCLSARQKENRVGTGPLDFFSLGMFNIPHVCAALAPH